MGYPKEVYDKARAELDRRAGAARRRQAERRAEIGRTIPEIARIETEMERTAMAVTRAVMSRYDDVQGKVEALGQQNLSLQSRRRELLEQNGYPPDYLEPQYACADCRDTGYVGQGMCSCLRQLLGKAAHAQLGGGSPEDAVRFADFHLGYYPDRPTDNTNMIPRQRMEQIYHYCMEYAESFCGTSDSLLFLGRTGLGKTHLSMAVATAVTEKGYGVLYTPVQKLMDRLEAEKFGPYEQRGAYLDRMDSILRCDLLILDDLGTEFTNAFTSAALYNIINSRLGDRRPTIISTNLELQQIEEKYSQRMVSRLVCSYKVLKFMGKDIRFLKRAE